MNAAEQLRSEILHSSTIDKKAVLDAVMEGIRHNGECLVWEPYNAPEKTKYNPGSIEIASLEDETAIREYCIFQGFRIKRAFHPTSGRAYGFYVTL